MAEKAMGVWKTILASVIAGIVLLIVPVIWPASEAAQWLVLATHAVQRTPSRFADAVVGVLTYPLPVWSFAVVAALVGMVVVILRRLGRQPEPSPPLSLSDLEKLTVEILTVADGERVPLEVIARMLNVRKLEVGMIFERLRGAGLIGDEGGYYAPGRTLSVEGRDYAFQNGLVGDQTLADSLRDARYGIGRYPVSV